MSQPKVPRSAATLLEVLLGLAIVITAVFGVIRPVVGPAGLGIGTGSVFGQFPSVEAHLDMSAVQVQTDPRLPSLADDNDPQGVLPGHALEMTIPDETTIGVYDPDLAQFLGLVGPEILGGMVATAVLVLLLLIVRTLRQGDPFLPVNASRLYAVAALIGFGGQAALLLRMWGEWQVRAHEVVEPYVLQEAHLGLWPLAAGLGIAVAAEVFRQGAALREEVEGLV